MRLISALSFLLLSVPAVLANSIETLYLQNNSDSAAYIWVNKDYQGYVPAGKARYTLKEGFVTRDSGFQADGTLQQTYSHAGWENSGDTITVTIGLVNSKGIWSLATVDTTGDKDNKAYVWFGEQDAGEEPDSLVWEDSSQIENERAPVQPKSIDRVAKAETKRAGVDTGYVGRWVDPEDASKYYIFGAANDAYPCCYEDYTGSKKLMYSGPDKDGVLTLISGNNWFEYRKGKLTAFEFQNGRRSAEGRPLTRSPR